MKGNDRIMSKKARQPRQLRALRSWLGLPQETQKENDYDDYDDYDDFFEEFNGYEDRKSIISDNDEYDYDSNYDYASNTEDAEDTENAEYFVENPEDNFEDDLDDNLDTEQLTFGSYAEESRARIARKFTVGSCYQVVTSQSIIKRLRAGGKYVLQPMTTSGNNDSEVGYTFRYLGKQGIHHMFREICGGWSRTYTDAQLVGKEVIEVSENDVIAVNRSLLQAGIRF